MPQSSASEPVAGATDPATLLAIGAVIASIVSLCVGTSFAKALFPAVGAEGTTALRVTIAALMLSAIWRPWRARLARRDLARVAVYGVTLGAMNLMFYLALRTVPLGLTIAIEFSGPMAVAIAASRRALDLAWIGLALLGLGLLLPLRGDANGLDPTGVALALGAGACWAAYIVSGAQLGHLHGGRTVALGLSFAALVALPFGVAHAGAALFDPKILLLATVVAVLSSAVPYSLEMFSLNRLPKQTFGVLLSLEPAVGSLAGVAILGERLSLAEWCAIGCIVTASAGAALTTRSGVAAEQPAPL